MTSLMSPETLLALSVLTLGLLLGSITTFLLTKWPLVQRQKVESITVEKFTPSLFLLTTPGNIMATLSFLGGLLILFASFSDGSVSDITVSIEEAQTFFYSAVGGTVVCILLLASKLFSSYKNALKDTTLGLIFAAFLMSFAVYAVLLFLLIVLDAHSHFQPISGHIEGAGLIALAAAVSMALAMHQKNTFAQAAQNAQKTDKELSSVATRITLINLGITAPIAITGLVMIVL